VCRLPAREKRVLPGADPAPCHARPHAAVAQVWPNDARAFNYMHSVLSTRRFPPSTKATVVRGRGRRASIQPCCSTIHWSLLTGRSAYLRLMLCLSCYERRCIYPGEPILLAPFREKMSLDQGCEIIIIML